MATKPKATGTPEESANKSWLDYWRIADALTDLKRLPLREHLG